MTSIGVASAHPIVTWYQKNAYGKYVKVNFVVPFVQYRAVVRVYSPTEVATYVQIREDVPFWFDKVVAQKSVILHKGWNEITIPFIVNDTHFRGVFVKIPVLYDVQSVQQRFEQSTEINLSGYYFAGLQLFVDGKKYDVEDSAPILIGSNVVITGRLIGPNGLGAGGKKIIAVWILNDQKTITTTSAMGYFTVTWVAPNWKDLQMCNMRIVLCHLEAIDENGTIRAMWDVLGKTVCKYAKKENVKVESIWISPSNPKTREEVTIYAKIKNVGRSTSTVQVSLFIDNIRHHKIYKITLRPNEEKVVSWNYAFLYGGEHTLTVQAGSSVKSIKVFIGGKGETGQPVGRATVEIVGIYGYAMAIATALGVLYILSRRF
ncbi:MAG: hypothetical protein L3J47_10905 [Sulfurovum sp.]|nr:hypothetical protein [Sulfurovum sp.]